MILAHLLERLLSMAVVATTFVDHLVARALL